MKPLFTFSLLILAGLIYGQQIAPDSTFGANGIANVPYGQLNQALAFSADLKQQSNGKFVVCGDALKTGYLMALARYNTDGTLDNTFSNNGILLSNLFGSTGHFQYSPSEMAIQSDDKIVVAGVADYSFNDTNYFTQTLIARYKSNGTPDSSFGTFGITTIDLSDSTYEFANSVGIQSDGKIVVAANASTTEVRNVVLRLTSNGIIDSTFGVNGLTNVPIDGDPKLKVKADDKIVVGGKAVSNMAVVQLLANGRIDSSFGTNGLVVQAISPNLNTFYALAVQPDGKILIGGTGTVGPLPVRNFAAMARLNTNGTPDSSFNGNGMLLESISSVEVGTHHDEIHEIAVQADGKILVGGRTFINPSEGNGLMFARFNADGSRDNTFNDSGHVAFNTTQIGTDVPRRLLLLPGGKFATLIQPDGHSGSPDNNFAVLVLGPQVTLNVATVNANAGSMVIAPNPLQANSTLQFELTEPELLSANVYDIQGRRVVTLFDNKMHTAGKYTYSIGNLLPAHGAYLVQLQGNNLQLNAKVIK